MNAPLTKLGKAAAARAVALQQLEDSAMLFAGTAPHMAARSRRSLVCAAMAFVATQMKNAATEAEEAGDAEASAHYQAVAEELVDAAIELSGKARAS